MFHFSAVETTLDYIFTSLGVSGQSVNHSVTMVEPLKNINWSRRQLSELLFELYQCPQVSYGADPLFAFNSASSTSTGLSIHSGHLETSIVPILNGSPDFANSAKISIGGHHNTDLLFKSLNIRFPTYRTKLTFDYCNLIKERVSTTAISYKRQLKVLEKVYKREREENKRLNAIYNFGSEEMYNKIASEQGKTDRNPNLKAYRDRITYLNTFEDDVEDTISDLFYLRWNELKAIPLTEEEIKAKEEQRKEASNKMKELMLKRREEKLKKMEEELQDLSSIAELKEKERSIFEEKLVVKNMTEAEFDKRLAYLEGKLTDQEVKPVEADRWALVDVPDEDLTSDQIRQKRFQKAHKNNYLARLEKKRIQAEQQ